MDFSPPLPGGGGGGVGKLLWEQLMGLKMSDGTGWCGVGRGEFETPGQAIISPWMCYEPQRSAACTLSPLSCWAWERMMMR
jgi:hypothetical protein